MSHADLEHRLTDAETKPPGVMQQVTQILRHLDSLVSDHQRELFGIPGDKISIGLKARVDRLEWASRLRHWLAGLAIGSTLTVLGHTAMRYLGF